MNDRDSEALSGLLQDAGFSMVDSAESAEIVLFNTCSVRQHAEEKVWSEVGRFRPRKNSKKTKALIGIIGCMAQNYKDEIFNRAPYVDLVAGPNDLLSVPLLIKELLRERSQALAVSTMEREQNFYVSNHREDKDHAYVVISEGCSNFCSYCVVPFVRGRLHIRDYRNILDEIKKASDKGVSKITLLGQNVNSYKFDGVDFVNLLEQVNSLTGLKELSFISSHPKDTSKKLFFAMRDLDKVKKSLHLPIQSGSDRILDKMNRGYTAQGYLHLVAEYRKIVNGVLGTDIIVGFPTETEKDFQDTYKVLKNVEFDCSYIFKYSPRPHTKAEEFTDDVSLEEKQRRHQVLLELQRNISKSKRRQK